MRPSRRRWSCCRSVVASATSSRWSASIRALASPPRRAARARRLAEGQHAGLEHGRPATIAWRARRGYTYLVAVSAAPADDDFAPLKWGTEPASMRRCGASSPTLALQPDATQPANPCAGGRSPRPSEVQPIPCDQVRRAARLRRCRRSAAAAGLRAGLVLPSRCWGPSCTSPLASPAWSRRSGWAAAARRARARPALRQPRRDQPGRAAPRLLLCAARRAAQLVGFAYRYLSGYCGDAQPGGPASSCCCTTAPQARAAPPCSAGRTHNQVGLASGSGTGSGSGLGLGLGSGPGWGQAEG